MTECETEGKSSANFDWRKERQVFLSSSTAVKHEFT